MASISELFHSEFSKALAEYGKVKLFKTNKVILDVNAYVKTVPLVLYGRIQVTGVDKEDRSIFLYYIAEGEICIMSQLAVMRNDVSKIKAVVVEDAEICLIPVDKSSQWIKEFPEWSNFVFSLFQKRFEELVKVVNDVAFKKMDERILDLLKKSSLNANHKTIQITHQELADQLGTARVVVSRMLKQMEISGLVKLSRNKISLL